MRNFFIRLLLVGIVGLVASVAFSTQIYRTGWSPEVKSLVGLILGAVGVNGALLAGMKWIANGEI